MLTELEVSLSYLLTYLLICLFTYLLACLLTYLLTPWSRVLLEKLTGFQLVKKFPAFYEKRMFITAFTSARHMSLSWASSIPNLMSLFLCLVAPYYQSRSEDYSSTVSQHVEKLLKSRQTPKLEDHTLSAVREEVSLSLNLKCASAEKKKRNIVRPSSKRNRNVSCNAVALTWRCVAVSLCRWHCGTQI